MREHHKCCLRLAHQSENAADTHKQGERHKVRRQIVRQRGVKSKRRDSKDNDVRDRFSTIFYNYKIPPQFPVSKGRKGKTSESNLPILFVLFFSFPPASFFASVSLSPTKTAKKPRTPGAFPSLVLFYSPLSSSGFTSNLSS